MSYHMIIQVTINCINIYEKKKNIEGCVWGEAFLLPLFPCLFPLMKATLQSFLEQWGAFVSTLLLTWPVPRLFPLPSFFTKPFILSLCAQTETDKTETVHLGCFFLITLPLHSCFRYCSVVLKQEDKCLL